MPCALQRRKCIGRHVKKNMICVSVLGRIFIRLKRFITRNYFLLIFLQSPLLLIGTFLGSDFTIHNWYEFLNERSTLSNHSKMRLKYLDLKYTKELEKRLLIIALVNYTCNTMIDNHWRKPCTFSMFRHIEPTYITNSLWNLL